MELKFERRSKLRISSQFLSQLLKLPSDVIIVGANYDPNYDVVHIHLKGTNPALYEVGEGGCSPTIIDFSENHSDSEVNVYGKEKEEKSEN
jgi:hypothetical protein